MDAFTFVVSSVAESLEPARSRSLLALTRRKVSQDHAEESVMSMKMIQTILSLSLRAGLECVAVVLTKVEIASQNDSREGAT